ncbi:hypothetical protein VTH82DRAFT_8633 [Thermothelomyces myriococcoides]
MSRSSGWLGGSHSGLDAATHPVDIVKFVLQSILTRSEWDLK